MSASPDEPRKTLERVHLARACFHVLLVPIAFKLGWQTSIALLFLQSSYANWASDVGSWQAARAERRSLENPPSDLAEPRS